MESTSKALAHKILQKAVDFVESKFDTKIFNYGVAREGTTEYYDHSGHLHDNVSSAEWAFWLFVPLDRFGNIATNQYYEKLPKGPLSQNDPIDRLYIESFRDYLTNYEDVIYLLQQELRCKVFNTKSWDICDVKMNGALITNAKKIEDISYCKLRFYATNL